MSFRCLIFTFIVLVTEAEGSLPSSICDKVDKIVVHYRNYYQIYLGNNITTGKLDSTGRFIYIMKDVIPSCCANIKLEYVYENTTEEDLETLVLESLSTHDLQPRIFSFYYPEFAEHKDQEVYDFELKFVKLSRSPGQAVVMLNLSEKPRVFLYHVFMKSSGIFLLLITLSWLIGILGWILDHRTNSEEFPKPFLKGMFEGFWWSVVTMTTVGYGDKAPRSVLARLLAVIWMLISAVLLSLFTANATAILNASQQEEDYSETFGKKIGVLQSKEFDEFQLNMGAEVINYYDPVDLNIALIKKEIDRFIFPNYKDLLMYLRMDEYQAEGSLYKIAKVFDSPFQIGMVLARSPGYLGDDDRVFLRCLRTTLTQGDKAVKNYLNYSKLAFPKPDPNEDSSGLNQESLFQITYYILGVIAFLVALGLGWDLWEYMNRKKTENTDVGNMERVEENPARPRGLDDATWF